MERTLHCINDDGDDDDYGNDDDDDDDPDDKVVMIICKSIIRARRALVKNIALHR